MWAVIDHITGTVTTETRVSTHAPWCDSDAGFDSRALELLRRGFRPTRLGAAETSPASGVWDSAFDDLSLMIFRQPTEPPPKFSISVSYTHLTLPTIYSV